MGGATIMIIDDQPDFRSLLADYLEEEGYDVMLAGDGAEALESINFKKPHIILLDVMMPKMNGYEVCRALKANPETSGIPIIFLTAKTGVRDRLTGFVSGGHRYLCKPLDLDELEKWVRLLLHYQDANLPLVEGAAEFEGADEVVS